jgi:hypothetical protein
MERTLLRTGLDHHGRGVWTMAGNEGVSSKISGLSSMGPSAMPSLWVDVLRFGGLALRAEGNDSLFAVREGLGGFLPSVGVQSGGLSARARHALSGP